MAIRAVVFDAYGTLFDTQSVRNAAIEACGDKGELVTRLWRQKQLEYTWLRSLMRTYADFAQVTREALDFSLRAAGAEPAEAARSRLADAYLSLDLHAEAFEALRALADRRLAVLSNGSPRMLDALLRHAGILEMFASVISVDAARSYKPDPACYALVGRELGLSPPEVLFVSSNGFDVAGAKAYGFEVAWIERGGAAADLFSMQRNGAETCGPPADHRIGALTDLAGLLGPAA